MNNFGKRFCAYMLDMFLLGIVTLALSEILKATDMYNPIYFNITAYLISILYFTFMEASVYQATFGKRFMGLIVCRMDGEKVTIIQAFLRNFSRLINLFIFGIGYILVIFTPKKQGLHDIIGRTLVISEEEFEDEEEYDDYVET